MGQQDRDRFAAARVARLATVGADGAPHLVPIVFVVRGDVVWSAVDHKPKSTRALRRLANIEAQPAVSLLVDHYDDDWTKLWWVRADGDATVVQVGADGPDDTGAVLDALVAKYPQYATDRPGGPLVRVDVRHWSSWEHSRRAPGRRG
ncbi:TIGR03668 family PPOX class F420-dependent oxidoreductase [Terrabacter terrigena]|uniref:TIGR03668 family PPOX class F420-dependent oxidoreductase n=1 Tax=Terrabacter terrigena TaxID=574718 RepID=A0ABW3MU36_9MICO